MDHRMFDEATRVIWAGRDATRRRTLGLLIGGLGALLGTDPEWGEAKKRKRKKKKKKSPAARCTPDGAVCPATTQRDCCGLQCCLAVGQAEGGLRFCTHWMNTCCTAEEGGGACPYEFPVCCPNGGCAETYEACLSGLQGSSGRVPRHDQVG